MYWLIYILSNERATLQKTIRNKKPCKTVLKRCQILLELDEEQGTGLTFVEPLCGVRHVSVREHRTALDWAEEMRYLVDVSYPDRDKIILVMDNLNTHALSSL